MNALGAVSVGLAVGLSGVAGLRTQSGNYIHSGSYVPFSGPLPTVKDSGDVPIWEFHYVEGTQCMDKKESGFWIREGNTTKLMVYLMGGGACFNPLCKTLATSNPLGFDDGPPVGGILRPNTGASDEIHNPLGDYTTVFIPYCTGDVFMGDQDKAIQLGLSKNIFKGRDLVTKVLQSLTSSKYISRTLDHFVLTGESAGGFGALASYDYIRTNFVSDNDPTIDIDTHFKANRAMLIDDSGVVMNSYHLTPCLTKYWKRLYNMEATIPKDCPECLDSLYNIYPFLQTKYDKDVMAFISTNNDETITLFYGFGFTKENKDGECGNALLPGTDPTDFKEGIEAFFNDYVIGEGGIDNNNFASYFFPGSDHTHSTQDNFFYKTEVFNDLNNGAGIKLVDWYQNIVDGKATDVESSLFTQAQIYNWTNAQ